MTKPSGHSHALQFRPINEEDIYLFKEGTHYKLYEILGAHPVQKEGVNGVQFAVWAPNAKFVSVIGDFNRWDAHAHPLFSRWDSSGIWEGFVPGAEVGHSYKFHIVSHYRNYTVDKKDPLAFAGEVAPKNAAVVCDLAYEWGDQSWMKGRNKKNSLDAPWSIYEVHLGSWRRDPNNPGRLLTYRELAAPLVEYVLDMGFTHVELLPVMEHPFYGSWGYQVLGYFAATSRYGTPQELMYLIDLLHQNGIGVILDWVPSHFPMDEHGLVFFDGTHLYEHSDPQKGYHPDWSSSIFNYGRNEIREFLISSALFWLEYYHVDALRVDAVASLLYLDYSRKQGEWTPNENGGRDNLQAISLIKKLNEVVYQNFPDVQMIAEESTSWPMVSRPVFSGGLGFGMKWNMGWMHDTLEYFSKDPLYRKYHHNELTFSMLYCFTENFVLALSHDEVVHGKGSLLNRMPNDDWQKFANLRLLFGYMYGHPGKKLLFMGGEFGQRHEWYHEKSLDWHLLQNPQHAGIQNLVRDLNKLYRTEPALNNLDFSSDGFEWIDCSDWQQGVISFVRKSKGSKQKIFVVCNLTPQVRENYQLGVPDKGVWQLILSTDASSYGGSQLTLPEKLSPKSHPLHGRPFSVSLTLPSLSVIYYKLITP